MWLGQARFFCTGCGAEITDGVRHRIERRCRELSIDPEDLGAKAREAARSEMLQEMGEPVANLGELGFIKATAFLLLELAYSPALFCDKCRGADSEEGHGEKAKLRLIKGGLKED
ncbi:MAG: hypothetical protein AB9873_11735 [Syntrophobacteraceae bacterium]